MGDVAAEVRTFLRDILSSRQDVIELAGVQRSKFEGWLKFELAARISKEDLYQDVRLEPPYGGSGRADLSFERERVTWFVELKTANTNWRQEGVENKNRPITRNITGIVKDINKVREAISWADKSFRGLVVFVIFPIPARVWVHEPDKLNVYLRRIEREAILETGSLHKDSRFIELEKGSGLGIYVVEVQQ